MHQLHSLNLPKGGMWVTVMGKNHCGIDNGDDTFSWACLLQSVMDSSNAAPTHPNYLLGRAYMLASNEYDYCELCKEYTSATTPHH